MKNAIPGHSRQNEGMALLVTVFVLLLVGAVAVAAIHDSGEEAAAGGRTRATMRTLYAADSGIELALTRLGQNPPNTNPFNVGMQGGRSVESRRRTDSVPQDVLLTGWGPPPEGYDLGSYHNELYRVPVTSTAPRGASAEVEGKIARFAAGSGAGAGAH